MTNLSIKPGEKIGVCGKTGSGKSTLILILFRLFPVRAGNITIDGVNLLDTNLEKLREGLIAMPQEPYILPGTVRFNAAPRYTPSDRLPSHNAELDERIVQALERVRLWPLLVARGGLCAAIEDIGLSHGQEQLFSLARASIRKDTSGILILDEAMSSVDRHTDELVRRIIAEEFQSHTVISVAHKLNSLSACDKVVVMDQGRIVESGDPRALLQKENGWWKQLRALQN